MSPSMQKRQIVVDLPRTNPTIELFQDERVQLSLHRLLYIWAIRHPGTGYVQASTPFAPDIAHRTHPPHSNRAVVTLRIAIPLLSYSSSRA
jgi:hypothetical protein